MRSDIWDVVPTTSKPKSDKEPAKTSRKTAFDSAIRTDLAIICTLLGRKQA